MNKQFEQTTECQSCKEAIKQADGFPKRFRCDACYAELKFGIVDYTPINSDRVEDYQLIAGEAEDDNPWQQYAVRCLEDVAG